MQQRHGACNSHYFFLPAAQLEALPLHKSPHLRK